MELTLNIVNFIVQYMLGFKPSTKALDHIHGNVDYPIYLGKNEVNSQHSNTYNHESQDHFIRLLDAITIHFGLCTSDTK